MLACILLIDRRIIFRKFTKIFAKVKISIVYLHINKHIKNKIMAKDISTALPKSNLYLVASGLDVNGNKVVKLRFPNERAFSIQTNSNLPRTHAILRGLKTPKDMLEVSKSDLAIIDEECSAFIKEHGSPLQKKKLKTY